MTDTCHNLDASRIVTKILRKALATSLNNKAHRFIIDFYWNCIVAIPLVASKSLRKTAYPHIRNAVFLPQDEETGVWRHMALPIAEDTMATAGA